MYLPGHLGSARSGEDVAAWPRRQYTGHIFGGHHAEPDQDADRQVDATSPAQRAPAQRSGSAERVAVGEGLMVFLLFAVVFLVPLVALLFGGD